MTERPIIWVVGEGGLLGRSVIRQFQDLDHFTAGQIDWVSADVQHTLAAQAQRFMESAARRRWAIVWCAGAGIIGTDLLALQRETELLREVLRATYGHNPGTIFLSSSAGGVYGGTRHTPTTEDDPTDPISDYGRNKLDQEMIVRHWTGRTGGRALIGRLSNLYGPGQKLSKQQGLISKICLSTLTRQPVPIYVSPDTLRDYIFVDDAAHIVSAMVRRSWSDVEAGTHVTKIVAAGSSVSIGAVLGEVQRVLGRRPTCLMTRSPNASQQGSVLAFRSTVWPEIDEHWATPLPVGIWQTSEDLRHQLRSGLIGQSHVDSRA